MLLFGVNFGLEEETAIIYHYFTDMSRNTEMGRMLLLCSNALL